MTSITAATSSSPARPWCSARKPAVGASCTRIFPKQVRGSDPAGYDGSVVPAKAGAITTDSGIWPPHGDGEGWEISVAELPKLSVRLSGATNSRHCIEFAKIAEANGYHCVWFAENAFGRGVLPAASACAMATQRAGIGLGVFNPYNRHPTLMAMEIGALDELAQGRARLGIGSGIAASTERMGLSTDRPLAAVRDAITIVRAMLKGEEVNYAGRVFSARNVKLEYQALPGYAALDGRARRAGARAVREDRGRPDDLQHVFRGVHASGGARGARGCAADAARHASRGRAIRPVRGAARPRRGLRPGQGGDRRDAAVVLVARRADTGGQGGATAGEEIVGKGLHDGRRALARRRAGCVRAR